MFYSFFDKIDKIDEVDEVDGVDEAMIAGLESQIDDLKRELCEYDALKRTRNLPVASWDRLGEVLVGARVAPQSRRA